MNGTQFTTVESQPSRRACLVDGCPCKDARIISRRRAAYVASLARANGQTADRIVPVEAGWRLPTSNDIDIDIALSKGAAA
jgi:hypothetical protein